MKIVLVFDEPHWSLQFFPQSLFQTTFFQEIKSWLREKEIQKKLFTSHEEQKC